MPEDIALPTKEQIVAVVVVVGLVLLAGALAFVHIRRAMRRWMFGSGKFDIRKAWMDVEGLMARGDEMSARLAVMHADAVLDKALQAKHFPGDKFATRLQFAQRKYSSLRTVWWAHTLRNNLAHEPDHVMKKGEAKKAVGMFKRALLDLGAL